MIQTKEKSKQTQDFRMTFSALLKDYMKTTALPEKIVSSIVDEKFIKENPVYYTYYPYLFNKTFKVEDKQVLNKLSLAGFLYYKAVILVDKIFDTQSQKESFFLYLVSDICKEESIKLLSSLFPVKHQFWKSWNSRKLQYVKAFEIDQTSHDISSYEEFEQLADFKSAFGKVAIDALYHFSAMGDVVLYSNLLNSHKLFYAAFQITDDVIDLKEDIENNQFNIAYYELQREIGKEEIKEKSIKELKNAMYLNGIVVKLYDKALYYLEKAKEIIKSYNLPEWKLEIQQLHNEILKNQLNITGFVNVFNVKQKLAQQKAETKIPEEALKKGITFIKNSQNKETGCWIDYFNDAGISDVWVTAFILTQENENTTYGVDTKKAITFLKQHTTNNIWGYNTKWIPDADSTTFVLRAFIKNKIEISKEALDYWYSFQQESGGFSTYNSEEDVKTSLNFSPNVNVKGWLSSHFCVSAAAYLFFCEANLTNEMFKKLQVYLIQTIKQDGNKSYWWSQDIYAFNLLLKGALLVKDTKMIRYVTTSIKEILEGNIFQQIKQEKNCFYLGYILEIIALSNILLIDFKLEADKILDILLEEQLEDGSWMQNASMRIPHPSVIDINSQEIKWRISDTGTNILAEDFHRLFTTTACISGISNYIKL